ncbi:MAG: hypothetical protein WBD24_05465 [Candidatus Omnitrophota bacterium]
MKKAIFSAAILLLATYAYAQVSMSSYGGRADYVPMPRLLSPTTTEVNLSGKEALEFKWSPHEGLRLGRKYYDFRLYEGFDMLERTLLFKERVPGNKYEISLDAEMFLPGKVYTWSLRQVYRGVGKSRRSFHSFRVIK